MALRKCGRVRVSCTYRDREDDYKCMLSVDGKRRGVVYVGAPRSRSFAVDSPRAYSQAAHAALSFGLDEGKIDEGELDFGDAGFRLTGPKRH